MKRGAEAIGLLVVCALIYWQLGSPEPTAHPTASQTAAVSSVDPISPPPGVIFYRCEHIFDHDPTQALFERALKQKGPSACQSMRRVVELEPKNPNACYHLALALEEDPARLAEAVQAATRAVELQPGFAAAWNARAYARAQMADPKAWPLGLVDVRKALGLDQQPTFYDTRGYLLLRLGRAPEALYDVEKAVREQTDDPQPLLHRAQVYEVLGRRQEAEQDRTQARKLADK